MVFYKQPSAPQKYRAYLGERLMNNEATVFIAYNKVNEAMGFVLNYHSFSSVSLGKTIILNDLFVAPAYRKRGVANKYCLSYKPSINLLQFAHGVNQSPRVSF